MEPLRRVIDEMPPRQAQVAFLFWRCRWKNSEIAEVLSISAAAVSQHVKAARARLRSELRSYVPFEFSEPEGGA